MERKEALLRARMRMWLRAERAFGLHAVAIPPPTARVESPGQPSAQSPTANLFEIPDSARGSVAPPSASMLQPFDTPVLPRDQKRDALAAMDRNEVSVCTRCRLCETRTHTVFGEGDADAQIMFIGEGPGQNEDETGRPFVGRAGEKLNDMIRAMGLSRQQVYIANIVKCRPPGNRVPSPDEVSTCTPYLLRQIEIIRPKVIVTLGLPASRYILETNLSMGRLRGHWHEWRGIKVMPTFHPAYILRQYTRETRAAVWSDLKQVLEELGLAIPLKGAAEGA